MSIQIGQTAPDFTLYNTDKQQVTLSSLRGKNVLLLFFPFAFTGTCTKELCATRDNLTVYQGLNAEVFGISVDNVDALKRFKEDLNLNFALLSDFNKEASTAYNSIYETFSLGRKGVSKRSAFVIDKEGMIRYAEILENPSEIPDFNKIQSSLKELNN
jgi:peroxiredoxin